MGADRRLLGLLFGLGVVAGRAESQSVSVGAGFRYASGSFGTDTTSNVSYVPLTVRVDLERLELAVSVPFLSIDTGLVAPTQGGWLPMRGTMPATPNAGMPMGSMMRDRATPTPPPAGQPIPITQSGLGDIVASAAYRLIQRPSGLRVLLGGRLKLPTADEERGLGTGRLDFGGFLTARQGFASGWVYGEAGYLLLGDPTGTDLRNAWLFSAGAGRRVASRLYILASMRGNGAILPELGSPLEAGLGLGLRLGERAALSVIPTLGLTEASPRFAVTISLGRDLGRRDDY